MDNSTLLAIDVNSIPEPPVLLSNSVAHLSSAGNFGSDFTSLKVQKVLSGGLSSIVTKPSMIRNTWSGR